MCVMCSRLLCPYLVCFPVLVSCRYELICVQLCVCDYVLITLCILVLSFEFAFVWSTRYSPVFLSMSVMPCLALPCLDLLKTVILSLCPRQRVPVSSSCLHRDTAIFLFFFFFVSTTFKTQRGACTSGILFFPA